jgi:electron transfer flavoprotein beta subunit
VNILVLLKMVPDVVEELEVAADGKSLNVEFLRLNLNERDNHALEQALLLKDRYGAKVTALALDTPEIDDVLFTALAKGVDRAVKASGAEPGTGTEAIAGLLAQALPAIAGLLPADLILTGCQAIDDLDGMVAPLLAHYLKLPYLGLVTAVAVDAAANRAVVTKEFASGVRGEFEVALPVILGIQAAEKPPRYVPVAKVRAAMKSQQIEAVPLPARAEGGAPPIEVLQLAKPETAGHAEMLEGSPEEIASKICEILTGRGLL